MREFTHECALVSGVAGIYHDPTKYETNVKPMFQPLWWPMEEAHPSWNTPKTLD